MTVAHIAEVRIANPIRRFGGKYLSKWCRCPTDVVELVAIVTRNGGRQYRPCCITCGYFNNGGGLPHRLLADSERTQARIVRANEPKPLQRCERCGKWAEVEIHHWAPRARFPDDFENWPTSPLCRECHVHWHQVMEGRA
jgi:hypothetical protein